MTDKRIEPQQLAAFLEGRLSEAERAEVVKILANSPESYSLFVETAESLDPSSPAEHAAEWASEEERVNEEVRKLATAGKAERPSDAGDVMLRKIQRGLGHLRVWWRQPVALAATAIAVVAFVFRRAILVQLGVIPALPGAYSLASEVLQGGSPPAHFAAALDSPGWNVTRGAGASLTTDQAAFRLGVRLVDLSVAVASGDSIRAGSLAAEMRGVLLDSDVLGPEVAVAVIGQIRPRAQQGAPGDSLQSLIGLAGDEIDRLFAGEFVALGSWIGAARLAVLDPNTVFLGSTTSRRFLARVTLDLPEPVANAMRDLEALVGAELTPGEVDEVGRLLATVLGELGG